MPATSQTRVTKPWASAGPKPTAADRKRSSTPGVIERVTTAYATPTTGMAPSRNAASVTVAGRRGAAPTGGWAAYDMDSPRVGPLRPNLPGRARDRAGNPTGQADEDGGAGGSVG